MAPQSASGVGFGDRRWHTPASAPNSDIFVGPKSHPDIYVCPWRAADPRSKLLANSRIVMRRFAAPDSWLRDCALAPCPARTVMRQVRINEGDELDEPGRYCVDADLDGAGAADDAGAGVLLRRAGALEERAQHDDDELHLARIRRGALGGGRVFARLQHRQQLARRHVAPVPARRGAGAAGHDSPLPVHGVSGHVLHHHGGADLGRDRRTDAVFGLPDLHLPVGAPRLLPDRPLGVGRRLAGRHGRARLRRRHRRARQCRRGGARRGVRRRHAARLQGVAAPAAQRAVHAARRRAALVRLVRLQRRQRARRRRALPRSPSRRRSSRRWARWSSGRCSTTCAPASRPRSAPRPPSSSAWSRSRRRPASSVR